MVCPTIAGIVKTLQTAKSNRSQTTLFFLKTASDNHNEIAKTRRQRSWEENTRRCSIQWRNANASYRSENSEVTEVYFVKAGIVRLSNARSWRHAARKLTHTTNYFEWIFSIEVLKSICGPLCCGRLARTRYGKRNILETIKFGKSTPAGCAMCAYKHRYSNASIIRSLAHGFEQCWGIERKRD